MTGSLELLSLQNSSDHELRKTDPLIEYTRAIDYIMITCLVCKSSTCVLDLFSSKAIRPIRSLPT